MKKVLTILFLTFVVIILFRFLKPQIPPNSLLNISYMRSQTYPGSDIKIEHKLSAGSTYFSPNYAIDDLNAIASIKKYPDANPKKIGVWGHSMGGNISLRVSEISSDIKAAVIWGGVVGD